VLTSLITTPALAQMIDFEELPASNDSRVTVSEEYAGLGAHFYTRDDGATWDGMSAGDPGGWGIDGTRGSTFLGFDGQDYTMTLDFDAPVEAFQLDVTRAMGAPRLQFDFFEVTGFLDGQLVESNAVFFNDTNRWQTLALTGPVDRVIWYGTGRRGHRFGVDNLRWVSLAPQVMEVEVDVRPRSRKNRIKLRSRGVVPVVLYGAQDFPVEDVDVSTLAFGPDGAGVAHRKGPHFVDIDRDGLLDMLLHHRVADTGIAQGDVEACLGGETTAGVHFEGCDSVSPVSRRR
jgi:hypothetical protein